MQELIEFLGKNGFTEQANSLKNGGISLMLNRKNIEEEGIKVIGEILKTSSTLTSLSLNCNRIEAEGAKKIGKALKTNSILTSLTLTYNNVGVQGAKEIAEGLRINTTLTKLDLSGNDLGDVGAKTIIEVLKTNNKLTSLTLKDNNFVNGVAAIIAEVLKINTVLTKLDLAHNCLAHQITIIAEALKMNTVLTHINLKGTSLGCTGVLAIAGVLKMNTTLKHLNLADNNVQTQGAKGIIKALKINTTLTSLNLQTNILRKEEVEKIHKYLQKNIEATTERVAMLFNAFVEKLKILQKTAEEVSIQLENNILISLKDKMKMQIFLKNIVSKSQELVNEKDIEKITDSMSKLIINKSLTKARLAVIEEDLDETIAHQGKVNETIFIEKFGIFQKILERISVKIESDNSIKDKKSMQNIINEIVIKGKALTNITDIEKINYCVKGLLDNNQITKGKLIDLEDNLNEVIDQQNKKSNNDIITNNVAEIVYEKPVLNYPELLGAARKKFNLSKIAELSNELSSSLIDLAINNEDGDLIILAGLMSLENSS